MTVSEIAVLLGIITAVVLAIAVARHPQPMRIMNLVWPITGLYLPVVAWFLYRALGHHHGHERRMAGSTLLSALHCGAGCVLGDAIGAPLVFTAGWTLLGERLFAEYAVEFGLATTYPANALLIRAGIKSGM